MRIYFLLGPILAGCAAAELPRNVPAPERDPITVEAKFAASEFGARNVIEVRFTKKSSALSASARRDLTELFSKAAASGKISEVKVIAWSDQDSAALEGESLPEADQNLAQSRIKSLEETLEGKARGAPVASYNMAQTPGALASLLNNSEFRLKESLSEAGIKEEGPGAGTSMAGKAIVMVILAP